MTVARIRVDGRVSTSQGQGGKAPAGPTTTTSTSSAGPGPAGASGASSSTPLDSRESSPNRRGVPRVASAPALAGIPSSTRTIPSSRVGSCGDMTAASSTTAPSRLQPPLLISADSDDACAIEEKLFGHANASKTTRPPRLPVLLDQRASVKLLLVAELRAKELAVAAAQRAREKGIAPAQDDESDSDAHDLYSDVRDAGGDDQDCSESAAEPTAEQWRRLLPGWDVSGSSVWAMVEQGLLTQQQTAEQEHTLAAGSEGPSPRLTKPTATSTPGTSETTAGSAGGATHGATPSPSQLMMPAAVAASAAWASALPPGLILAAANSPPACGNSADFLPSAAGKAAAAAATAAVPALARVAGSPPTSPPPLTFLHHTAPPHPFQHPSAQDLGPSSPSPSASPHTPSGHSRFFSPFQRHAAAVPLALCMMQSPHGSAGGASGGKWADSGGGVGRRGTGGTAVLVTVPPSPAGMGPHPLTLVPSLPAAVGFQPISLGGGGTDDVGGGDGNSGAPLLAASAAAVRRLRTVFQPDGGSLGGRAVGGATVTGAAASAAANLLSVLPATSSFGAALQTVVSIGNAAAAAAAASGRADSGTQVAGTDGTAAIVAGGGGALLTSTATASLPSAGAEGLSADGRSGSLVAQMAKMLADALAGHSAPASARLALRRRVRAVVAGASIAWTAANVAALAASLCHADFSAHPAASTKTLLDLLLSWPSVAEAAQDLLRIGVMVGVAAGGSHHHLAHHHTHQNDHNHYNYHTHHTGASPGSVSNGNCGTSECKGRAHHIPHSDPHRQ